jgi:DNA-binding transcriptional MerR regulator
MLTIGQLAAYAGVTVRAVRHYHQVGLLPEPERDASGYRRYGPTAVVALIRIRTLAGAGVPLSQIGAMLDADPTAFALAVQDLDSRLRAEIDRLEATRKQIAQLTAGDGLGLPPEVTTYLHRLREVGTSERMIEGERDGWLLLAARWPDSIPAIIESKLEELKDPRVVRLYQVLSALTATDVADEALMVETADLMVVLMEQSAGDADLGEASDDLPFDLMDALADEADPRVRRLRELIRERGWARWTRLERMPDVG